jgi:23S rRNA (guanine745-N1)-methyltransferase
LGIFSMLSDVIDNLICPICSADVVLAAGSVRCRRGHSFDVAREGYVNLLAGAARSPGDSRAMIEARDRFFKAGHYRRLADMVAGTAATLLSGAGQALIVEAGAGTGYYLARVLEDAPQAVGLALDISKFAVRRAARAHPRIGAAVCDTWRGLPARSGTARVILDVFAPRNAEEFRRVVHPDGVVVVATPTKRHLFELTTKLGLLTVDERKDERVQSALGPWFELASSTEHEETRTVSPDDAWNAAAMGPSAFHIPPAVLRTRADALPDPLAVTVSVRISVYRPKA